VTCYLEEEGTRDSLSTVFFLTEKRDKHIPELKSPGVAS